jgi:hypothetical protein
MKIILIIVAVFGVFAILGIAGLVYTGYLVKEKIEQTAEESGINLADFTSGEKGQAYEPCSLLTQQEASQVLGVTVVRLEPQGATCNYYVVPPSGEAKSDAVAKALESLQQSGASASASAGMGGQKTDQQKVEDLAKAFVGSAVDPNTPYITVEVHQDGKAMIAGMKLAMGALGGAETVESLQGVADEALLGPMASILMFVKNGTGIQIDLRQVGQGRERGIQLARHILARM